MFVYLAAYAALGAGARDSGGYYSPFASPIQFAKAAVIRTPILLANAFLGVPSELSNFGIAGGLAVAGVVAGLGMVVAWRAIATRVEAEERAALPWLVAGALVATLAAVGAYPGARVLQLPNFGFAPLIAIVVRHAFARGAGEPGAFVRRAVGGLLVAVHLALAPLVTLGNIVSTVDLRAKTDAVARDARRAIGDAHRVFVVASDPFVGVYAFATLEDEGGMEGCSAWLSGAKADMRITRSGPASFTLEPMGTTMVRGAFERVYRDPSIPFHEGDEVTTCGARVRVLAIEDGLPKRIEVDMAVFDADDVVIVAWENGALGRFALPASGESKILVWSKGPSGFF